MKKFIFLIFLIGVSLSQTQDKVIIDNQNNVSTSTPPTDNKIKDHPYDYSISDNLKEELSKPIDDIAPIPTSCKGICQSVILNLPWTSQFTSYGPWSTSHGTPNTGASFIHLWSMDNASEGINLKWNFQENQKYCLQELFYTNVYYKIIL